jgi:hypothetical protein
MTLANRVVPYWSFHVRRAGTATLRRSAARLCSVEEVVGMVHAFLTGSSKVWGRLVLYQVQDRAMF